LRAKGVVNIKYDVSHLTQMEFVNGNCHQIVELGSSNTCYRCQKARVECIEHVARRRPAKPRTVAHSPSPRASQMEKKIDSLRKLSAFVTAATSPSSIPPQPTLPPVNTVPSQPMEGTQCILTPAPIVTATQPPPSTVQAPTLHNIGSPPESLLSFWESLNDIISEIGRLDPAIRSISVVQMQVLLDTYRIMADFFPFIILPKECSCTELIQQRPMLMFAVLTAASYDSSRLQLALSREFRKVIMLKIMKGEKSLDLLQALLVFVAWHHHYMDAQAISINLLLRMCVGMAGELGLGTLQLSGKNRLQKDSIRERDAKRTYLGCYYLATNIELLDVGSARSMLYSSVHRTYASELASAQEHRSDVILPILVDSCQFTEDVEETFRNPTEQVLVVKAQLTRLGEKWDHMRLSSTEQAAEYSEYAPLFWSRC
jgi:hypothetical protein